MGPVVVASRVWGLGSWFYMLGKTSAKMFSKGMSGLRWDELTTTHLAGFFFILVFMAYAEGYRGFHKSFSPMLVKRTWAINEKSPWHVHLLAPLYVGGFIDGTTKRLLVSWGLIIFIVGLVIAVAHTSWPWHQLIDLGVGVGISIGLVSTVYFTLLACRGTLPAIDGQFRNAPLLELSERTLGELESGDMKNTSGSTTSSTRSSPWVSSEVLS
jgi:hypothetical protein